MSCTLVQEVAVQLLSLFQAHLIHLLSESVKSFISLVHWILKLINLFLSITCKYSIIVVVATVVLKHANKTYTESFTIIRILTETLSYQYFLCLNNLDVNLLKSWIFVLYVVINQLIDMVFMATSHSQMKALGLYNYSHKHHPQVNV